MLGNLCFGSVKVCCTTFFLKSFLGHVWCGGERLVANPCILYLAVDRGVVVSIINAWGDGDVG